jgi:two-component system, NarL family, response regulator DesR
MHPNHACDDYLSAAMTKLGVSSRHAAAHRAWEQGWI